jgi:hypothetical protein
LIGAVGFSGRDQVSDDCLLDEVLV